MRHKSLQWASRQISGLLVDLYFVIKQWRSVWNSTSELMHNCSATNVETWICPSVFCLNIFWVLLKLSSSHIPEKTFSGYSPRNKGKDHFIFTFVYVLFFFVDIIELLSQVQYGRWCFPIWWCYDFSYSIMPVQNKGMMTLWRQSFYELPWWRIVSSDYLYA